MKLNGHLLYDLKKLAPKGLYLTEQSFTEGFATISITIDITNQTDMLFLLLGDQGEGVQIMGLVPVEMAAMQSQTLVVEDSGKSTLDLYANDALSRLIKQLNQGINNNPGLAPTSNFEYNSSFYQWTAVPVPGNSESHKDKEI